MQVDVISTVNEARSDDFIQKTVIVIDVLRATSTIVTALASGCSDIVPVETVNQARPYQGTDCLLGGERFCKKITGFHLGNSPAEYAAPEIAGKRIVLTTTNGTRAVHKAQRAGRLLIGSFLNAEACAQTAFSLNRDIVIVCAGTQDEFCLEDGLCAGLLLRYVRQYDEERTRTNDTGTAMLLAYETARERLSETLLACASGQRLTRLGHREDVLFCSQTNHFDLVPVWKEQALVRF
ncbi:2-phosphosulfolactate phosphatase [Paenibacillus hodogayensis]|uniref:Probable 2-phosphosulfolactate phosphatase n=1 Tax=Paenibacillus hodogayensis TaxID=279208 RepID=A0ABV5W546_9BACL